MNPGVGEVGGGVGVGSAMIVNTCDVSFLPIWVTLSESKRGDCLLLGTAFTACWRLRVSYLVLDLKVRFNFQSLSNDKAYHSNGCAEIIFALPIILCSFAAFIVSQFSPHKGLIRPHQAG